MSTVNTLHPFWFYVYFCLILLSFVFFYVIQKYFTGFSNITFIERAVSLGLFSSGINRSELGCLKELKVLFKKIFWCYGLEDRYIIKTSL